MTHKEDKPDSETPSFEDSLELFDTLFKELDSGEDLRTRAKRRRPVERPVDEGRFRSAEVPDTEKETFEDPSAGAEKANLVSRAVAEAKAPSPKVPGSEKEPLAVKPEKKKTVIKERAAKRLNFLKLSLSLLLLAILVGAFINYYGILDFGESKDSQTPIKKEIIKAPAPKKPPAGNHKEMASTSAEGEVNKTPMEMAEFQEEYSEPAIQIRPEEDAYKRELAQKGGLSYPYSIYFGSYGTLEGAKKTVSMYRTKGLSPYWVKVDLGKKGIWYRIFTGHFSERARAEAFINEKQLKGAVVKETKYSALIGIYSSEDQLQKKSLALSKLGYCPYVINGMNGKSELHSGAYGTRASAEQHYAELASEGIRSQIVER